MHCLMYTCSQHNISTNIFDSPFAGVLEKPLEKKAGRNYGPPGTKKLIYFVDDMNMPEVQVAEKLENSLIFCLFQVVAYL